MLKKFLTLSLVAVILSVTAFATPTPIAPMTRVLADEGFSASITAVAKDNVVIDTTNGLSGSVTLTVESDAAYENAIVVTAVFDGASFLTASIADAALVAGSNEEIINLPTAWTEDNDSYDVKFYLWESKTTLEPLAQPVAETVTPQAEAPEVWSGSAATGDNIPQLTSMTVGEETVQGYAIYNADQLAWFSDYVDTTDATANAILMDDIYLNGFFEADGVTFDEDWYESVKKNDWYTRADDENTTKNWYDYAIGRTTAYAGIFDGNDKTIYGLYSTKHNDNTLGGLFFNITGGTVKNLTVKGAYVISQRTDYTYNTGRASVIANLVNGGTIEGVEAHGLITAAAGCSANLAGSIAVELQGSAVIKNNISHVNIDLSGGNTTLDTTPSTSIYGVSGIVGGVKSGTGIIINGNKNYGNINAPYSKAAAGILAWANSNTYFDADQFTGNENHGNIVAGQLVNQIIAARKGGAASSNSTFQKLIAQNTASDSATATVYTPAQ